MVSEQQTEGWSARSGASPGALIRTAALCIGSLLAAGCDVINPGPVQDEFLTDPPSHMPFVQGAHTKISEGVNLLAYLSAVVAREVLPSGETTGGATVQIQAGQLLPDQTEGVWADIQQARFIAEEALRRFALPGVEAAPEVVTEAHIWAGHANRILGELWCEVTFDGGPAVPGSEAFARAEEHFASAIGMATTDRLSDAAHAGRAQARLGLRDWTGAAADAAEVPVDFVWQASADGNEVSTRNLMFWQVANTPYRIYTMNFTAFYDYYTDTGDPRAEWRTNPGFPNGTSSLTGFGIVPWSYQVKFTDVNTPYNLASGREMLLIRAEAALANDDVEGAVDLLNEVRALYTSNHTGDPLEAYVPGTAEEAWTALKRERALELFGEGRRLFDIRRWEESSTPGDPHIPDFESLSPTLWNQPFSRCYPISQTERLTNPNLN